MTSNSNFAAGIFISLLVHAIAFTQWKTDVSFEKNMTPVEGVSHRINVQLVKYIKPVVEVIEKAVVQKNSIQPIIKEIVQKVSQTPLKDDSENIEPLPVIEDTPTVELDEKVDEADEVVEKGLEMEAGEMLIQQVEIDLQKDKEDYIKLLLAHIEAYKFYPGAARRRAIEGKLNVTFLLHKDGSHDQLTINGGRAVLQRAVRQALDDAQPFPKPPASLQVDQRIAFSMVYELE